MNKNTTSSNVCLVDCKEQLRECITTSSLNISCDDILASIQEPIDIEKFKAWLSFNLDNFKSKQNQTSYFKKSFQIELSKGTFALNKVNYIPNTQPLINAMREKGICVSCDESAYVYELWHYLLNVKQIDYRECMELNHKVLDYMQQGQSFSDYKELLMNSNTLKKYDIDWELIDKNTEKAIKEWHDLLEDMKESEDKE